MKRIQGQVSMERISFPIALVCSRFNQDITGALLEGSLARLKTLGFKEADVTVVEVPGAREIPIVAKKLAEKNYHAIVALGAVIRGETTHYEEVCRQVSDGCMRVTLDTSTPVIVGVLTTENDAQAWDRLGGAHGHKGVEAIDAAITMVSIMQQLEGLA